MKKKKKKNKVRNNDLQKENVVIPIAGLKSIYRDGPIQSVIRKSDAKDIQILRVIYEGTPTSTTPAEIAPADYFQSGAPSYYNLEIVSTSALDDADDGVTGEAQVVKIIGLANPRDSSDPDYSISDDYLTQEEITLDGLTPVLTENKYRWCHRLLVLKS